MENLENINNNSVTPGLNLQNTLHTHAGLAVLNDMIQLIQQFQQTAEYQKNVYGYHNVNLKDEYMVDLFIKFLVSLQILSGKLQSFELSVQAKFCTSKYTNEVYYIVQNTPVESWLADDLPGEKYIDKDLSSCYYGLIPGRAVHLQKIKKPMQGLDKLGTIPVKDWTIRHKLMNNYCIQIIVGIITIIKHSVNISEKCYKDNYKYKKLLISGGLQKYGHENFGKPDFLWNLCVNISNLIDNGNTAANPIARDFTGLFIVYEYGSNGPPLKFKHLNLTLSQARSYYLNKYPGLQLQFENPLEYFTPGNTDDFDNDLMVWLMFANVPNIAQYQQLSEIRDKLQQIYTLLNNYDSEQRLRIFTECVQGNNICNLKMKILNNNKITHNVQICEQMFERHQTIEYRYKKDEVFQQICILYMDVFEHPFGLLEQIYHQAREKRAELAGSVAQEYTRAELYKNK